ncbi:MAG: slipin family protein [Fimbriimonadaceae bacterium]|nr:slipin family protein [Fimbriimonadaceae bacterium]
MDWLLPVGVFVFCLFLSGFRVAQEWERALVFRLGRCMGFRGPGLFWMIPFFEYCRKIDTRVVTVNVEPQETITKDSVTIKVNAVLWYKVVDPERAIVKVADFRSAVYQIALTTLRNVIGQHLLDEVLRDRDAINEVVWRMVDESTEAWGIKIEMVEMKDVDLPQGMQRAMAKEAEALREKRARLIKAEAEQEASEKLTDAARLIASHPAALELRRMQMLTEIGAEQNSTTIVMMPSDFVTLAHEVTSTLQQARLTTPESTTSGESVSTTG